MMPNFLIIGAQKSASTFVHQCLREHPEVFLPRYEIPFFEDPNYSPSGIDQFEQNFKDVTNETAIGIKRPDYLARPECPERIQHHIPNTKLILVLRNPVDRAVSAYYWYMQVNIIPLRPIEVGLQKLIDGDYQNNYPKSQEIIEYGFYSKHIKRYLSFFSFDQILILQQQKLIEHPKNTIIEVFKFLEVEKFFTPKGLEKRPKKSVYSYPRLKWLSLANKHFFYDYQKKDNKIVTLHAKNKAHLKLFYGGFVALDRVFLSILFPNPKPDLSNRLRDRLQEIYRNDTDQLEKLLGWDLTMWKN